MIFVEGMGDAWLLIVSSSYKIRIDNCDSAFLGVDSRLRGRRRKRERERGEMGK